MSKKKSKSKNDKVSKKKPIAFVGNNLGFWSNLRLQAIVIFLFGFLLYSNTLTHSYTQDDAIVLYDNMYTQKGIAGIPGLLQKDTFHGFFKEEGKEKLVSGGRYRPFTPIMFAIGWQLFGDNPFIGHLMNVFWYSLLGIVLFFFLRILIVEEKATLVNSMLVFFCCMFFMAHPVHTEVVANIKGRDEIIALLGSIGAAFFIFRPLRNSILNAILVFTLFFIGLLSKENTITFLAVVPLAFLLFRKITFKNQVLKMLPLILATLVFLIIRTSVLGIDFGGTPSELMNNPYLKVVDGTYVPFSMGEKFATIFYTLGKYLLLLIFPLQLTHDYYPYHIPIMSFSSWQVWLSIGAYVGLAFFALYRFGKRSIPSFSIFYFVITLSIVSNLVFPIGTNMSERFLFMPSVGFTLLLSIMLIKYVYKNLGSTAFYGLTFLILILFSAKTVTRNMVWQDDFTLFQTDVLTSKNSAKVLHAAGGSLLTKYSEDLVNNKQDVSKIDKAIQFLERASSIHPKYRNVYLLLGNAYFYKKEYPKSIKNYETVLEINPGNVDGSNNLAIALREQGRFLGEKQNDLNGSIRYLKRSFQLNSKDPETLRLLGVSHGIAGQSEEALKYFKSASQINPEIASNWLNLSMVYEQIGDAANAKLSRDKALSLDPNIFNKNQ